MYGNFTVTHMDLHSSFPPTKTTDQETSEPPVKRVKMIFFWKMEPVHLLYLWLAVYLKIIFGRDKKFLFTREDHQVSLFHSLLAFVGSYYY